MYTYIQLKTVKPNYIVTFITSLGVFLSGACLNHKDTFSLTVYSNIRFSAFHLKQSKYRHP